MCGLRCFCIGFSCLVLEHLWKFLGFLGVRNRHECYCQWHIYVAWNPLTPSKTQPTFCSEKISPVRQCANILVNTEASDGIWESSIYCRWPSFICCCSCTCWWFKTQDLFNGSGTVSCTWLWMCHSCIICWVILSSHILSLLTERLL